MQISLDGIPIIIKSTDLCLSVTPTGPSPRGVCNKGKVVTAIRYFYCKLSELLQVMQIRLLDNKVFQR